MFWLTNPEHGEMAVYDMADVERHKQWGWVLLNEGEAPQRGQEAAQPVEPPARKKPGPKPKVK